MSRARTACLAFILVLLVVATLASGAAPAFADEIVGTPQDDVLEGTARDDAIHGLEGNDQVRGGQGADVLDGGPGADDLSGGPGRDAVTYADSAGVEVTLDDLANDGAPGEHDNVQTDVEDLYGGPGADTLTGSAAANGLDAGAGNDRIVAGGGEDSVFAGEGDDQLYARDGGVDQLDCGEGFDIAVVDELDGVTGCEVVDRRPAIPRVDFTIKWTQSPEANATRISVFRLSDLSPRRVTVRATCRGRACRFKSRTRSRTGSVDVRALIGQSIPASVRIEVWLIAREHMSKILIVRTDRAGRAGLTTRCARPGSRRLTSCPKRG